MIFFCQIAKHLGPVLSTLMVNQEKTYPMTFTVNTSTAYAKHQSKELEQTRLKKCITRVAKAIGTLDPVLEQFDANNSIQATTVLQD